MTPAERYPNQRKPISIRGVSYPSMRSAARALGVSNTTIMRALNRGTHETSAVFTKNAGTLDGVWYYCKADAAWARGVNASTFRRQIRKGKIAWMPEVAP